MEPLPRRPHPHDRHRPAHREDRRQLRPHDEGAGGGERRDVHGHRGEVAGRGRADVRMERGSRGGRYCARGAVVDGAAEGGELRRAVHGGRSWRRLAPMFLLLAADAALAGDPPDFDKAVARCHGLVRNERFADGERAIRALFTDFNGDARVRGRLTEIEDDLKVCLFRQAKPAPTGKDLFGTACEQFNAGTRAVTLEYYKPHGAFWTQPGGAGLCVCKIPFEGDVTVSFVTDWINKDRTLVSVALCWDDEGRNGYLLFPGFYNAPSALNPTLPGEPLGKDEMLTADRAIVRVKAGAETRLFQKP